LKESKAGLEAMLGRPVTLFSFPHGACNERLVEMARGAGYERVFTITPQPALAMDQGFIFGRVAVNPEDWALEFRLKVLGAYRWMAKHQPGSLS
jgi:hypothetical protein